MRRLLWILLVGAACSTVDANAIKACGDICKAAGKIPAIDGCNGCRCYNP